MKLEGKVAMVTGGGSGIGRACGLMLAGEGADLVIADINLRAATQVLEEAVGLGGDGVTLETDTSIKKQVHRLVAEGIKKFGKIDILVNCAGVGSSAEVRGLEEETWDRVIAVHLKSTFLSSQAVLESMVVQGWGRIVNVISRAAFRGRTGIAPYATAKGGMLAFSRVLALEVGQYGITVNNVAPGTTSTPMVESRFVTSKMKDDEARTTGVITKPVRLAEADEIAQAVLYFCGPNSDHTSGMTIHVNGGSFMP